jgi:hypothetical protein
MMTPMAEAAGREMAMRDELAAIWAGSGYGLEDP